MKSRECVSPTVFDSIVQALMRGGVVPFVGAGISVDARAPGSAFEPRIDKKGYLWKRLRAGLGDELRPMSARRTGRTQNALSALGHPRCRTFGTMAEVYQWLAGQPKLCEVLDISSFAHLEPRPAHYALGCLVLEGLIEEVISTNWDTCIEGALSQLCGETQRTNGTGTNYSAISSLTQYRERGAKRRGAQGATILRLYKINGCALEYSRDPNENANDIIITERQLQEFGKRSWARDLLRDRARSRTLLFSGFGSDEPQVRHTVLELMEEISREEQPAPAHELFVTAYEPWLSFSQQQVLRAFCLACDKGTSAEDKLTERSLTGRDASFFEIANTQRKLPADHFWCALFEAAVEQLLRTRYTKRGFALWTWLDAHMADPEALLFDLTDWLFPRAHRGASAFRCALPGLFGPHPTQPGFTLMRWIEAMQGHASSQDVPQYRALRDRNEPLLPLATLATLYVLSRLDSEPLALKEFADEPKGRLVAERGRGLRVSAPPGSSFPRAVLLVAEAGADFSAKPTQLDSSTSRVQHVVSVPRSLGRRSTSRQRLRTGPDSFLIQSRLAIPAEKLLELSRTDPQRGWHSLATLFAERDDPSDERRKNRLRPLPKESEPSID